MNGDDRDSKSRSEDGNRPRGREVQPTAAAAGAPGEPGAAWRPAPPPGWGPPPGMGSWPVRPGNKGVFRQHPLLMILLILLIAGAFITILGAFMSRQIGQEVGAVSSLGFGKKVAVVKVEGVINESKEVVDQLHRYLDDGSVAAVVLRVDSPGGVVGAAQEIHDEVKKLARKKPVVVSMGSVAASGGYYVSCPARKIFANPGTITGSIGVIMEVTNLEGLFQWMKVKEVVIKSGAFKDVGSPYREMTRQERDYLQQVVDNLHQQFEDAVAQGRGLPLDKVRELADGRIYTGVQARDLGLVDTLGSQWDAIDEAAKLGGIKGKPRVIWPPRRRSNLLQGLMGSIFPGLVPSRSVLPSPVRVMYMMDVK